MLQSQIYQFSITTGAIVKIGKYSQKLELDLPSNEHINRLKFDSGKIRVDRRISDFRGLST
ncbi:MAG TPA: hypothetical protein DD473_24810 [Planctomycetaceae bacterium]|nr:hypothetical protein [Planctomycetaceae bacterium]